MVTTAAMLSAGSGRASGVAINRRCISRAIIPAVWGQAMLVPESVAVAVVLVYQPARTFTPGAAKSTHDPQLLNEANASERSVAPTVRAAEALAGDKAQAFEFEFPAATAA